MRFAKKIELEEIPPEELSVFFSECIIAARMKKGEHYELSSLRGVLLNVEHYLSRHEHKGCFLITNL